MIHHIWRSRGFSVAAFYFRAAPLPRSPRPEQSFQTQQGIADGLSYKAWPLRPLAREDRTTSLHVPADCNDHHPHGDTSQGNRHHERARDRGRDKRSPRKRGRMSHSDGGSHMLPTIPPYAIHKPSWQGRNR